MERRRLGKTDMNVSVLGFGGSEIGYENASLSTVNKLLNKALDAGLNVIDTAECYVASEELIGRAIGKRRNDYYLFTKGGHERGWSYPDWRPESLLRSLERSLKRLKTDYVDLMQLHSCSEAELRKGHVIDALRRARERGYTRYIGYSGDSKAAMYAVQSGAFDTLQTSVNIADQEGIELYLPLAQKRDMGVIAKRPLANVAWHKGDCPPNGFYGQTYWERLQSLRYPFLEGDFAGTVAIALRFALSVPAVHTAIVGTSTPGRFKENSALIEAGTLPQEVFDSIRVRWRAVAQPSWIGQT
jgi:aryl-alcohol dehydrogenase-like predicted oxidoreductase